MYLTSHSTANSGSDYDSSHCCDEQTEDEGTESKWISHLLEWRRKLEFGLRGISVLFNFIRWLRMRTAPPVRPQDHTRVLHAVSRAQVCDKTACCKLLFMHHSNRENQSVVQDKRVERNKKHLR